MDLTRKSGTYIAEIKSTTAITKAPFGSFEAILSTAAFDRDKEIVDPGCFEPTPDHITIDIDHAMTVEKTVASGRPFYDGPVLKFDGTYASHPLAQMVRSLVDEGHIRTMSVAYMNAVYETDSKDGLKHLRKAELLNAGIVGIPANREALITASKSLAAEVGEAVAESKTAPTVKDVGLAQSAHDALVALGAVCGDKSHTADETKSVEISTETTPEQTAAPAAVKAPAAVDVATAKARIAALEAELALT